MLAAGFATGLLFAATLAVRAALTALTGAFMGALAAGLTAAFAGAFTGLFVAAFAGTLAAGFAAGFAAAFAAGLAAGLTGLADLDAGIVNLRTTKKQTNQAAATDVNRVGARGRKTGAKGKTSAARWVGEHLGCSPCGGVACVIDVTAWPDARRCCCRSFRKNGLYLFRHHFHQ